MIFRYILLALLFAQHVQGADLPQWRQATAGDFSRPASTTSLAIGSQILRINDVQLGRRYEYLGSSLSKLLASLRTGLRGEDLAILHFANGMMIPLTPPQLFSKDEGLFVARKLRKSGEKHWSSKFPRISRPDPLFRDPMPIVFQGLKMVVAQSWVTKHWNAPFNPFPHVSSPIGVSFVSARRLLDALGPNEPGRKVFQSRCQYCHGMDGKGAHFGWDFLGPLPIVQKRAKDSLYFHVRYPKPDVFTRGIRMPHQPNVTQEEINQLWAWLHKMTKSRVP